MNTLIKNLDEENWHFLKVEAAKERTTLGNLLNRILEEYKSKENNAAKKAWNKIFAAKTLLTKANAKEMLAASKSFRKEYNFEG